MLGKWIINFNTHRRLGEGVYDALRFAALAAGAFTFAVF